MEDQIKRIDILSPDREAAIEKAVTLATGGRERVLIVSGDSPLCAILPAEDLDLLSELEDMRDAREAALAKAEASVEGWVTLEEAKSEFLSQ